MGSVASFTTASTSGSSMTISAPSGVVNGGYLQLGVYQSTGSNVTLATPSSTGFAAEASSGTRAINVTIGLYVLDKQTASEPGSYSITLDSHNTAGAATLLWVPTGVGLDGTPTTAATATSPLTVAAFTTTHDGDLLLGWVAGLGGYGTPSGFTLISNHDNLGGYYLQQAAHGSTGTMQAFGLSNRPEAGILTAVYFPATVTLSATVPATATFQRAVSHPIAAIITHAASLVAATHATFFQTLSASAAAGAMLSRATGKGISATSTHAASFARATGITRITSAVASATFHTLRNVPLALTTGVVATGMFTWNTGKLALTSLTASAGYQKSISTAIRASLATTAILARATAIAMSATANASGAMQRAMGKAITTSASATASLGRAEGKSLSASIAIASIYGRTITHRIASSAVVGATMQRATAIRFNAGMMLMASMAEGKAFFVAIAATFVTMSAFTRDTGKQLVTQATTSARYNRATAIVRAATLGVVGLLQRATSHVLDASAGTSASLAFTRGLHLAMDSTITTAATFRRGVSHTITATAATIAALASRLGRQVALVAQVMLAASYQRATAITRTATVSVTGTFRRGVGAVITTAVAILARLIVPRPATPVIYLLTGSDVAALSLTASDVSLAAWPGSDTAILVAGASDAGLLVTTGSDVDALSLTGSEG